MVILPSNRYFLVVLTGLRLTELQVRGFVFLHRHYRKGQRCAFNFPYPEILAPTCPSRPHEKTPFSHLVPGYKSVNQVFPLRWVVYFKIMVSNIWYISCTRKPTQPLDYENTVARRFSPLSPSDNFHCQTTLKNAKFDLFGSENVSWQISLRINTTI